MLDGQKIVVVMPAYNAARTLQRTYDEVVAQGIVDLVIVVDGASRDDTVAIARTLEREQVEWKIASPIV
jgi:glycosyltransferase involved in cell wall biosynthesis